MPPCRGGEAIRREAALLKVGLTGGIASGKSTVGKMFAFLGTHVIQADAISHQLMQPGTNVYAEVVRHFGSGILDADGKVNRVRLAEAVFSTKSGPPRIQELNQIMHPAVIRCQNDWMNEIGRREPHAIAMVEAALLLEADACKDFDRIIVVTCRPEQRVERWASARNVDRETAQREVARRMANQWSDAEKVKAADYVIDNSGSVEQTRIRVQQLHQELEELSRNSP